MNNNNQMNNDNLINNNDSIPDEIHVNSQGDVAGLIDYGPSETDDVGDSEELITSDGLSDSPMEDSEQDTLDVDDDCRIEPLSSPSPSVFPAPHSGNI
jgi:hypothetical protein